MTEAKETIIIEDEYEDDDTEELYQSRKRFPKVRFKMFSVHKNQKNSKPASSHSSSLTVEIKLYSFCIPPAWADL